MPLVLRSLIADRWIGATPAATLPSAIDGSPVRDPAIWKPLHTDYWNALLQPFGLAVSDDMPFWAERFTLLFDAEAGGA